MFIFSSLQLVQSHPFRVCPCIYFMYRCIIHVSFIVLLNISNVFLCCCKLQIIKRHLPPSLCMPLYLSFCFSISVSLPCSCSLPLPPSGHRCQGRASNCMKGTANAGYRQLSENNDCTVKAGYMCLHVHKNYSSDHHETTRCHLSSTLGVT